MKETDLRIGNLVNYETLEGDVLPNIIDWQDLKWLSEDEQSFNLAHSPIPLTEEWLLKFGFKQDETYVSEQNPYLDYIKDEVRISMPYFSFEYGDGAFMELKHVHQLQNLYFALTGTELIQK